MNTEFKEGDIVTLKSGGPKMTVEFTENDSKLVYCTWFDGTEKKEDSFFPDSIKIVE